jgi:hypothetical protein
MDDESISWLVRWALFSGLAALVWWWWGDTLWYAVEYWVVPTEVNITHRPTDCDFWRAPIGEKPWHYEREVYGHLRGGATCDAQLRRVILKKARRAGWWLTPNSIASRSPGSKNPMTSESFTT